MFVYLLTKEFWKEWFGYTSGAALIDLIVTFVHTLDNVPPGIDFFK